MIAQLLLKRKGVPSLIKLPITIVLVASLLLGNWPIPFLRNAYASFPAIQGTPTCTADTSSTSFTVTLPTGVVAGELLMLFMSATTTGVISQSSGSTFTQIDTTSNGAAVKGEVWARIATGGDTNPVFTQATASDDVAVIAVRINNHGVSSVSTDIFKGTAATGGTGTQPNPPTLTPSLGAKDYLWLAWHAADDDDDTTGVPTNYTGSPTHCQSANSTSSSETSLAYRQLNSSNQDPDTFTISSPVDEEWISNTFAIRPPVAYSQAAFRFYEDGTESGSTPIDAQDVDISRLVDSNSSLHLRLRIDETAGAPNGASTDDWQLQYSKNAGAYTDVTTSSSNVIGFNSGSLTDAGATTNRATNGISDGSGTFVAGKISEDGLLDNHQLISSNFTEHLFSLTLVAADLANTDTLDFRLLYNGAATAMTFSVTPTITITKTGPANDDLMRHGNWWSGEAEQSFSWAD